MRRFPWVWAVGLSVLWFQHGNYWSAHWLSKWAFLLGCFSIGVSVWAAKRTAWVFFPLMVYCLLSAHSVGIWPQGIYRTQLDIISLLAVEKNALYAYVVALASILLFGGLTRHTLRGTSSYLAILPLLSIVATLLRSRGMGSLFYGNASMNGCLIASLLPFTWAFFDFAGACLVTFLFGGLAIYMTGASIPVGILGIATCAYLWRYYEWDTKRVVVGASGLALLIGGTGYAMLGSDFLDNSGRFHMWQTAWGWWHVHATPIFGAGLGSVQVIIPIVQASLNTNTTDYFMWLHNEYLQILFELGWLGVACVIPAWSFLLTRSWKKPEYFAAFCSFSVMGLMNYPLRLPIHAFTLLLLCCLILREESV